MGIAGNVGVDLHFDATFRGGQPQPLAMSYKFDVNGKPYQFQLYPEVASITPAAGSTAGGTLVKITGRGFPTSALGIPSQSVDVSIAGVPCKVQSSTYDTVYCITGPQPDTPPASATSIRGLYPSGRGVEYEFYNVSLSGVSNLWRLNKTITVANNGTHSTATILKGVMETQHFSQPNHCTRMKAFFIPPRAGTYRFYMQADDIGQLNITYTDTNNQVVTRYINLTSWTDLDNYFTYSFQASPNITLAASQPVLLEAAHCNGAGQGSAAVAVRMPVPAPQANSLAEVQTITAKSVVRPRTVYIKYLYGAGANTTAKRVTIAHSDDARIDDPGLGIEINFRLGANTTTVVIPATTPSANIDDMIEAAFGGNFVLGSNNAHFGVRKTRVVGSGKMELELAMNSDRALALDFEILTARPVNISATAFGNFSRAACTWFNPLLAPPGWNATAAAPAGELPVDQGYMLLLQNVAAVAAVVPSGSFSLGLAGSASPLVLPFTANTTILGNAVKNLTGLTPDSVKLNITVREGTYFARVWTVTFSQSSLNSAPDLIAAPADDTPAGAAFAVETVAANPVLAGSFSVSFGAYCESIAINIADSEDTVRLKLAALPGLNAPQRVRRLGSASDASGLRFEVTFNPLTNPGDQPKLAVADVSGLTGIRPTVDVTVNVDGSSDAFYAPITTEFLRLAVATPGTIEVAANGVPASCTNSSGACVFAYSDAVTPSITAVSPGLLSFDAQTTLPLTITGSGFDGPAGLEVKVGGAVCAVTASSATSITCDVPQTAPAGVRLVTVNVIGLGYAKGAANVTLETLYVTGVLPSPVVTLSGTAGVSTLVNFTGKGFDRLHCGANALSIGELATGVVACGAGYLTVLYTGNGTDAAAANVTAQVFEAGAAIDWDSPTVFTVNVDASAGPAVTGVTSPLTMSASGGAVTVTLANAAAADVASMALVPKLAAADLTDFTALAAAFGAAEECGSVAAAGADGVSCLAGAMTNGEYHVLVRLSSGLQLLSAATISFDMVVTAVSPAAGSIGGGTVVTISGSGFSPVAGENVVFINVPTSTTFLNGIIQCITTAVNATTLTCVTRPHLAANADASDPFARNLEPVATTPGAVEVVLCDPVTYNATVLREYCRSRPDTPRARYALDANATAEFAFSAALTPVVQGVSPALGYGGMTITVAGQVLADVTAVELQQGGVSKGACAVTSAGSGGVSCTLSALPPGAYNLVLKKDGGEASVDPLKAGVFTYQPVITDVSANAGSLAGGMPLTLTVGGAGLALGPNNATAHVVTVAGLPCNLTAVDGAAGTVTCLTPAITGWIYAEYWNLASDIYTLPDLLGFTKPGEWYRSSGYGCLAVAHSFFAPSPVWYPRLSASLLGHPLAPWSCV